MAQKTMATCPECGAKVRKDNLKGHIERVHRKIEEAPKEKTQKTSGRSRLKKNVSPWPAIAIGLILGLSAVGVLAYTQMASPPTNNNPPPVTKRIAIVNTNYGTFKIELHLDKAPITAGNFIRLAEQGFYNGKGFHRVLPGFVIQAGEDPTGTVPSIPWENTGLKNVAYSVAMARQDTGNIDEDKDSATSQFYVNLVYNENLDTDYTYPFVVFGNVIEGHSVVDAIGQQEVAPPEPPIVTISSITIIS